LNVNEWIRITGVHATFEATGRFGSAWSGSQCASLSVRVAASLSGPGPGPAAASQAVPARQMHRSQVPSSVMARAGRRGSRCPRDTEAPHGPAGQLTGTCSQRLGLGLGPLCTPPWPVFVLGICRCTDVKIDRDATRGPEWRHSQVPTPHAATAVASRPCNLQVPVAESGKATYNVE
jgi:hypothetical protein